MLSYPAKRKAVLTEMCRAFTALLDRRIDAADANPGPPEVPLQSLPFDHESTDDELAAVLTDRAGTEILWVTAGKMQSAVLTVYRGVVRHPNGDYIDIITDTGYRSIYLDNIVSVG